MKRRWHSSICGSSIPGTCWSYPRAHLRDVRELDPAAGTALMLTVARITRAVGRAFPNEGLSLWHSVGPAAFQEVPHLHIHVHPRRMDDGFLRVYPGELPTSNQPTRDRYAELVRAQLEAERAASAIKAAAFPTKQAATPQDDPCRPPFAIHLGTPI